MRDWGTEANTRPPSFALRGGTDGASSLLRCLDRCACDGSAWGAWRRPNDSATACTWPLDTEWGWAEWRSDADDSGATAARAFHAAMMTDTAEDDWPDEDGEGGHEADGCGEERRWPAAAVDAGEGG